MSFPGQRQFDDLTQLGTAIAHLKIVHTSAAGYLKAAICGNREEAALEGRLDTPPVHRHDLC